ncbi:putative RNA polymerase sigma-24 subunit [Acaryochloris phage A-HIS2]|nr:putative RNA polymerase sigma-24 subunit [Acaryochloris phage A-HIS2]
MQETSKMNPQDQLNLYQRVKDVAAQMYTKVDEDVLHDAFLRLTEVSDPTDYVIKIIFRACQMERRRIIMTTYQGKLGLDILEEIMSLTSSSSVDPDVDLGFMDALGSLGTYVNLEPILRNQGHLTNV